MDSIVIAILVVQSVYAVILKFIACEIGERLSGAFSEINDVICRFDWYLFPAEVQRILPIVMVSAQHPVDFVCFGSITANWEFFKKVSTILERNSIGIHFE